jgi:hypothetical protein
LVGDVIKTYSLLKVTDFDVITCIESCHYFDDLSVLFQEVHTFMQATKTSTPPMFVLADWFEATEIKQVEQQITRFFDIKESEDATYNVMLALDLDSCRRKQMLSQFSSSQKVQKVL